MGPRQIIDINILDKPDNLIISLFVLIGVFSPGGIYLLVFNPDWIVNLDILKILFLSMILSSPFIFDGAINARTDEVKANAKPSEKKFLLNSLYSSFIIFLSCIFFSYLIKISSSFNQILSFWFLAFIVISGDLISLALNRKRHLKIKKSKD